MTTLSSLPFKGDLEGRHFIYSVGVTRLELATPTSRT